ncbi:MAG: stealth family protein [Micropruina sp.]|nr:stealth family protein [Micropruina sp.]
MSHPAQRVRNFARRTRLRIWRLQRRSGNIAHRSTQRALGRYRQVVATHDHWAYLAELTKAVSGALSTAGIEHLILPDDVPLRPTIAIRHNDAGAARKAIAAHPATASCWLSPHLYGVTAAAFPAAWPLPVPPVATGLVVSRHLITKEGRLLSRHNQGVLLDLWDEDGDGLPGMAGPLPKGALTTRQPNGVLNYVSPRTWAEAQENDHRLPATRPHLLTVTEPVDIVYTWVDGDDPTWKSRKQEFLGNGLSPISHSSDSAISARFESRDELRYSLRSVQQFANWVRRVWIVTDAQVPAWLLPDERLQVIDHRDIFADVSALPAFNSHAIESQLHHIPGLADHYLYFNDDMLFGAPVRPEAFFHGNGLLKVFPSPALIDPREHADEDQGVTAAAKNNRDFIESIFGQTITNKLRHTPQAQRRTVLEEFEREYPEVFDTVMRSRFRSRSDHALPSSLSQYYAIARGYAVPDAIPHAYVDLAGDLSENAMEFWLRRRVYTCLCINDSGGSTPQAQAALRRFFEGYFPLPSVWEKELHRPPGPL